MCQHKEHLTRIFSSPQYVHERFFGTMVLCKNFFNACALARLDLQPFAEGVRFSDPPPNNGWITGQQRLPLTSHPLFCKYFSRRSITRENEERSFIYKELLILRNLARKQFFLGGNILRNTR